MKSYDLEFSTKTSSASNKSKKIAELKQMLAATGELKLRFDNFLNPNDVKNTYRAMEKDSKGPKQIAPADNEDGMMNKPTPLNKKGGSNTYSGDADKNTSGQPTGESMPVVKDDGYTATSDDDSLEDYIEWVEPLQNELEELAQLVVTLAVSLDCQINEFWNYVSRHGQGHLPPIKSAEQMKDILKTLGLDHDYIVQPQTIYASNGCVKEYIVKLTPKK